MPLRGPNIEDERKLHAEINQINNQRFLISTVALSLSGLILAWLIPNQAASLSAGIGAFHFSVAIILSVLLFGLYALSHSLRRAMTIISLYLIETKASNWEVDIAEFRRAGYSAYTKPQTLLFVVLNALAVSFPFLLASAFSVSIQSNTGLIAAIVVGTVTELLMALMGFFGLFQYEAKTAHRWRVLNARKSPQR